MYKKEKRKISSEKEHDPVTETFPRPTFSSAWRKLRALSSFLEMNIQGFLKSGRCLLWKSITLRPRVTSLKPLKQGTLLITCYPAVHDQRSPRKIFGKRIETYTSDTLSKRHCVAVYYRLWHTRGGEDVRKRKEGKEKKKKGRDRYTVVDGGWSIRSVAGHVLPCCSYGSLVSRDGFWATRPLKSFSYFSLDFSLYSCCGKATRFMLFLKRSTRIWFCFFLFWIFHDSLEFLIEIKGLSVWKGKKWELKERSNNVYVQSIILRI